MKKQIKDLNMEEMMENINNDYILALMGMASLFENDEVETLNEIYPMLKKYVELLEKEIEVDE
jgi:hypothetical protein